MAETGTSFAEKRKDARYEGIYAEYDIIKVSSRSTQSYFKSGFLRNFSKGGVSLFLSEEVGPQEHVRLRLHDPQSPAPISAIGTVVWQQNTKFAPINGVAQSNIGVQFIRLSESDEGRLDALVEYCQSKKH